MIAAAYLQRLVLTALVCAMAGVAAAQTSGSQAPAPPTARDLVFEPEAADLVRTGIPRGYAVVIGIAQYDTLDASMQLQFAESDAEAMYRVLISQVGGAFPAENVRLLKGRDATLANIRLALEEWLPSVAKPEDRVVVYFAGHGLVKNGRGYLAPADVDPARVDETSYPMTQLGNVLANQVQAGWKVLLTDACHSGKVTAETTNEALEQQFNALPASFLTLTATTEREQSFEDPALATGHGFFTYFLVQAFQGYADRDPCDGRITADELIEYVRSNVRRYARERQLSQTPTARGDFEPDMLLGVAERCLSEGATAPSMLGTAVIEANMDDVAVYVDGNLVGRVSRGKPLIVPSLPAGVHDFEGVKEGYEPDRKQIMIAPGQDATVTLRIRYVRQVRKTAWQYNQEGEQLLFTRRSSMSLANLLPMERRQSEDDLRRAAALFEKALGEDPQYALAAYHLGQVQQLLLNHEQAVKHLRHAIAIDPTHVDARTLCAAVLIELGDPDEAIRELVEVLRLEPANDQAYSMLSRAYWDKGAWPQAIEQADKALALNSGNAQAHLWKADALRQLAAGERNAEKQRALYSDAREGYRAFLQATNFSSGVVARLAFHFVGFRVGSRAHADRQGAYDSLRSSGFMGLCLSEHKVGNPLRAREYCQRALQHAPDDPIAHFLLGNVNRDIYNARPTCQYLVSARTSYRRMLEINSSLNESNNAKFYLSQIEKILPDLGCRA